MAYDINGKRPPNEYGKDVFKYVLCNKEYCSRYATESFCRQFTPIFPPFANNRGTALDICERYPLTCSQLLKYDNYEFKDDYPYKL